MATGSDNKAKETDASACDLIGRIFECGEELALHIVRSGRMRDYPARELIVRRGDAATTLHIVVLGRAHALVYTIEGQVILLQEYRSGDFFGGIGSGSAAEHEADIVVIEAVCALLLDSAVLAMLAERHSAIGLALVRLLLERLRATTARMYERAALSAVGRVHAELLRQARQSADLAIRPCPVVADLALRVSTTRETASRAVNALERRGIIRRDQDKLVLVAPHRLEELIL